MTRKILTDCEISYIRKNYPNTRSDRIAAHLSLTIRQIYGAAKRFGLKKSAEFLAGPESGRLDGMKGESGRFMPGQKPWNTGMIGYQAGGRSHETRFKPGARPHTWNPVGHERITKDGYLERKMTDTGVTRRDYVAVHRLIWEQHNEPIPAGGVIVFRDKNPQNLVIENLELITRAELARRNTIHRYPIEIVDAISQVNGLRRRIKNIEKKRSEAA